MPGEVFVGSGCFALSGIEAGGCRTSWLRLVGPALAEVLGTATPCQHAAAHSVIVVLKKWLVEGTTVRQWKHGVAFEHEDCEGFLKRLFLCYSLAGPLCDSVALQRGQKIV